jgi:hypothetical protein
VHGPDERHRDIQPVDALPKGEPPRDPGKIISLKVV